MNFKGHRSFDKLFLFYIRKISNHPFKVRLINWASRVLFNNRILVKSDTGSLHAFATTEYIGQEIIYSYNYEPLTLTKCKELLSNGGNFIDIGANMGLHSLYLSPLKNVNIYSVEPSAGNFKLLLHNIALNNSKNIYPINIGLSDKDSFGYLGNSVPKNSGTVQITEETRTNDSYLVRLCTLADLIKHLGIKTIQLIKIDVEGFEMNVFKGFFGLCDVVPENIIMEFNADDEQSKYTAQDCVTYFENLGYQLHTVTDQPYQLNQFLPEANLWLKRK